MPSQALAGQSSPSFDGKRIFPSPLFTDKIVVEIVSRKLEDYSEIPYGTPFPANSPQASLFPNHRLTLQVEQSEEKVARYYAADRANQEAYNGSVSYSGESKDHPIFTRDYIVRRSEYEALDRLAPLTGITSATVFTGGHDFEDDPEVELSGGTGTGGEITAVVSNGAVVGLTITNPGNYSVAPAITITGGTGATAEVTLQAQGAVLVKEDMLAKTGDERIDGLYVLVRLVWEVLPGPILYGQDFDRKLGIVRPFRKQITATGEHEGEDNTTIDPISSTKQEVITTDLAAFQAELDAYLLLTPTSVRSLRLPEVLKSVTIVYNVNQGDGESDTTPTGAAAGSSISLSLSDHSHSQGSAAVVPDLIAVKGRWNSDNRPPGVNASFFVPDSSSRAEVVAILSSLLGRAVTGIVAGVVTTAPASNGTVGHKLALNQIFKFSFVIGGSGGISANTKYYVKAILSANTFTYSTTSGGAALTGHAATSAVTIVPINEMPLWFDVEHTFIGKGQNASVAADASAQQSVTLRDSETSYVRTKGRGKSREGGLTNRSWQIAPTIHGLITVNDSANPGVLTAIADAAATTDITPSTNWPPGNSDSAHADQEIEASVTPLSLAATSPAAWPTEGLYITEYAPEPFEADRTQMLIQWLDFATIPAP